MSFFPPSCLLLGLPGKAGAVCFGLVANRHILHSFIHSLLVFFSPSVPGIFSTALRGVSGQLLLFNLAFNLPIPFSFWNISQAFIYGEDRKTVCLFYCFTQKLVLHATGYGTWYSIRAYIGERLEMMTTTRYTTHLYRAADAVKSNGSVGEMDRIRDKHGDRMRLWGLVVWVVYRLAKTN